MMEPAWSVSIDGGELTRCKLLSAALPILGAAPPPAHRNRAKDVPNKSPRRDPEARSEHAVSPWRNSVRAPHAQDVHNLLGMALLRQHVPRQLQIPHQRVVEASRSLKAAAINPNSERESAASFCDFCCFWRKGVARTAEYRRSVFARFHVRRNWRAAIQRDASLWLHPSAQFLLECIRTSSFLTAAISSHKCRDVRAPGNARGATAHAKTSCVGRCNAL